jgi:hypothetical protein
MKCEYVQNMSGMIMADQNRSVWRKDCPCATYISCTDYSGINPGIHGEKASD